MVWKALFRPRILERGYEYYDEGKVKIIELCERANEEERQKIRDWFWSYKKGGAVDWIEEYLLDFRNANCLRGSSSKSRLRNWISSLRIGGNRMIVALSTRLAEPASM